MILTIGVLYFLRQDFQGRATGGVFNLHHDYSRIFVGGFPIGQVTQGEEIFKIQESVRATFMDGQIEGLTIGDQEVGLWNYADAQEIQGAPGRNKFKKTAETSVRYVQFDKRFLCTQGFLERLSYPG